MFFSFVRLDAKLNAIPADAKVESLEPNLLIKHNPVSHCLLAHVNDQENVVCYLSYIYNE